MESDEDTGGEDVVDQDPPVQADHSEKNSHKKKKKTKEPTLMLLTCPMIQPPTSLRLTWRRPC